MPHIDNPIGRCYLVMEAIWNTPPKEQTRKAFEGALGGREDDSVYFRKLASLFKLPAEIRREATHLAVVGENLEVAVTAVEGVLSNWNTSNNVDWFKNTLGHDSLTALDMGSKLLSSIKPQPVASNESLGEIVDAINDLDTEIDAADISAAAKRDIRAAVVALRDAVDLHDLDGGASVAEQGQRLVGISMLHPDIRRQTYSAADERSPLGNRLGLLIASITLVFAGGTFVGELPQYVDNWSPPAVGERQGTSDDGEAASEDGETASEDDIAEAEIIDDDS